MTGFLTALGFLTVWRLPLRKELPEDRGRSVHFFALVGLLIGGLLVAVDYATRPWWPSAITNVIIVAVLLGATGALHFDGLLDTCDGIFSTRTAAQRLEIMRDSRSGAFAVAAAVIDLLLLWACLVDLTGPHHYGALLIMTTTSRAGMALAVTLFPYARKSGLGKDFRDYGARWSALPNLIVAGAVAGALFGWQGAVTVIVGLASAIVCGMYLMTRLPGLTGDCYGAINEIVQIATLLTLVALFA